LRKPRQASLRRAVSTAYYALFHALIDDGIKLMPADPYGLRFQVGRAFGHGEMKSACSQFAKSNGPDSLAHVLTTPLDPKLNNVAAAFVSLQELRHRADYNLMEPFAKLEAAAAISLAKSAFDDWKDVRQSQNAKVFLAALLLQQRWSRSG
jgi:hypothetical protein